MNHRLSNQLSLGRATGAKTFTRNSNLSGKPRNCRQARTRGIVTNRGCAAWFKQPLSFAFTLVSLSLAILPAAAQAEACPNAPYRVGASAHLPDCRAYELVSPVEKNGAYINTGSFRVAPGGESVGFASNSGFAGATSNLNTGIGYQASRSAAGWSTIAETQSEAQFIDHHKFLGKDFFDESFGDCETFADTSSTGCDLEGPGSSLDPGLEKGVRLWSLQGVSEPESGLSFYRTGADGVNVGIGPVVPSTATELAQNRAVPKEAEEIKVLGWSADASHVVFEDPEPANGLNQWSFGSPGALLEYVGTGHTEPAPVVPDPATEDNGCTTQILGGTKEFRNVSNPISTDGSRIFFTDACKGELFARVNGGQPDAETIPISEPSVAECAACDIEPAVRTGAQFLGASEDGSKVFFYTAQPLLGGSGGLYEYDFSATGEKIARVASGTIPPMSREPGGATVLVSEDGAHVYFLSEDVLTEQPSPDVQGLDGEHKPVAAGAVAQPGLNNLYVFERDSTYPNGHLAFVADLSERDIALGESEPRYALTPDGRFLVLNVVSELTSDDTAEVPQVFEYDAATGNMTRVSRGENGYNGDGNGIAALIPRKGEGQPTFNPSYYFSTLPVSADGAYVFFQSGDGLMPEALNKVVVGIAHEHGASPETEYAQNVYEYHAGNVSLISDGQDTSSHNKISQVRLLSADVSGRDVFFETTDPLVGQDTDSNKDIYDARVEGGFPAPVVPAGCEGDACQGSLAGAPVLLSPGSEFQAGGNPPLASSAPAVVKPKPKAKPKTKRCKHGTTLKRGKCVRQKAKQSTRRSK